MEPPPGALASLLCAQSEARCLRGDWERARHTRSNPELQERMRRAIAAARTRLGAPWGDALRCESARPGHLRDRGWDALSGAYEAQILAALRADLARRAGAGAGRREQVAEVAALARSCAVEPGRLLRLSEEALALLCATPAAPLREVCAEFARVWREFPGMRRDPARYELTLRLIHARFAPPCVTVILHAAGFPDRDIRVPLFGSMADMLVALYSAVQFPVQQALFKGRALPIHSSTMRVDQPTDLNRPLHDYGFSSDETAHVHMVPETGHLCRQPRSVFRFSAEAWQRQAPACVRSCDD